MFDFLTFGAFLFLFTLVAGLVAGQAVDYVRGNSYPRLLPKRDLMAPDTEPTDEELRTVTAEAGEEVRKKTNLLDERLKNRITEEVQKMRPQGFRGN